METLPGGGGNHTTGGGGSSNSPRQSLGKENAAKLRSLGPEGEEVARLAAETAPQGGAQKKDRGQAGGTIQNGGDGGSAAPGSSRFDQVVGQVTGTRASGGMGVLLPLLIGASILAAGAYLLGRRRPARPRD